jgi:hypothetical protein
LSPGRCVREPFNFIKAPETLSPIVAWRLWWWVAVVAPWWPAAWWPAPVVRVVFVVVVVVVVVAGAWRALVRVPARGVPMILVLKLGFARVVLVVRGTAVRRVLVKGMVAGLVGREFWKKYA